MAHSKMLESFEQWIETLRGAALERRNARIEKLKTPEDVAAWSAELRQWYREQVGPLLQLKGEQRSELCGKIQRDGYHIEKWLFEAMPGTMSSANLYVPPKPNAAGLAVLFAMGHWTEGKANRDAQATCAYLASHGVPAMVYDHSGVGERREFWNPVLDQSRTGRTPTSEHNRNGDQAILAGIQPVRFFLTEAAMARDFLASFDYVKRDMIGITGASGGGTMSRYAAACLDDLAFSIPVCIVRGESIGGGSDAEQSCWNAGVRGVSAVDLLAVMAPKPTMLVSERSFDKVAESYATLKRIYAAAGADENATACFGVDDVHGYTHPMIEAVYRFLRRNFDLPEPDGDVWNRIRLLSEEETWTSRGGLIYRARKQTTLQQQLVRIAPKPAGLTRDDLPEVLSIADLDRSPVEYLFNGQVSSHVKITGSDEACDGELGLLQWPMPDPQTYPGDGGLYKCPEANAGRTLRFFDRTIVGLRVRQILDFLADNKGKVRTLEADGQWALPLAFAAAMAPEGLFEHATARYLPLAFRDWLDAELNTMKIGMMAHNLLAYGDMDDVIAIAGDRLTVEHRVDADWRVVRES
ncbi:MAG: hypothetical protein J7M14_01580 [Planctomycetes bacterium]|nr:hypothetical protein [Planctomycetota bacterium]